jgi:hypothetical protein
MNITTVLAALVPYLIVAAVLVAVVALTALAVRNDPRGLRRPPQSRRDSAPGLLPSRPYREVGIC